MVGVAKLTCIPSATCPPARLAQAAYNIGCRHPSTAAVAVQVCVQLRHTGFSSVCCCCCCTCVCAHFKTQSPLTHTCMPPVCILTSCSTGSCCRCCCLLRFWPAWWASASVSSSSCCCFCQNDPAPEALLFVGMVCRTVGSCHQLLGERCYAQRSRVETQHGIDLYCSQRCAVGELLLVAWSSRHLLPDGVHIPLRSRQTTSF